MEVGCFSRPSGMKDLCVRITSLEEKVQGNAGPRHVLGMLSAYCTIQRQRSMKFTSRKSPSETAH